MIWFAWRVQRLYLVVAAAVVAGIAVWFTIEGRNQDALWNCLLNHIHPQGRYAYCSAAWRSYNFVHLDSLFYGLLYAVPGLLGMLLGAPLVARELDQKTSRIAWTQSVTRTRWLVTKLLLVGGIIVLLTAGIIILSEWWGHAVRSGPPIQPVPFDATGIAPAFFGVFAFLLGVALGALIRRTGWALFLALPLFAVTRTFMRYFVRPHLASTSAIVTPSFQGLGATKGWILREGFLPLGQLSPPTGRTWNSWADAGWTCYLRSWVPVGPNGRTRVPTLDQACLAAHRLHYVIQYQPQSHYWQLQVEESAIFLVAGLALAAVAYLVVRRRSA